MTPPETATATREPYGIVQMPLAIESIEHANAAARWPLTAAIWKLQSNPRPDDHEPADDFGKGFAAILVRTTVPKYQIIYVIDDTARRVTIVAITEARWKQ